MLEIFNRFKRYFSLVFYLGVGERGIRLKKLFTIMAKISQQNINISNYKGGLWVSGFFLYSVNRSISYKNKINT